MSIQLVNISKHFGEQKVLSNLSFVLPDRGIVGVFGPSGCGKTTLLRLLAGLENPDDGQVSGLNVNRISMVFQEDRLLPWLTVLDNIAFILNDRKEAALWLAKVKLADHASLYPAELSGGMKRRLALARALARKSDLLILDEPFTGMDDLLKTDMLELIRHEASQRLVILVSHDREDLASLTEKIIYL